MEREKIIVYGVIVFVFLIITIFAIYLYDKNLNNTAPPNAYKYRRLYHQKTGSYVGISLIPGAVSDIEMQDRPGYFPVLSVGASSRDALGLWDFIPNNRISKGQLVWSIQNEFSLKYPDSLVPREGDSIIGINGSNLPTSQDSLWLELIPVGNTASLADTNGNYLPPQNFRINVVNVGPVYKKDTSDTPNVLRVRNRTTSSTGGDVFELRVPLPSA